MKGRIFTVIVCILNLPIWALKNDPWIPPPYEFQSSALYAFSYFPYVDSAINPTDYSSYINQMVLEIGASATTDLFFELEVEFDDTRRLSFNLESVSPSIKYQLMNDLTGDMVALTFGGYFRYVPYDRLSDVATPYSGEYNFDLTGSIGKEFNQYEKITGSFYALLDVGLATVGKPWILGDIMGQCCFLKKNFFAMGAEGYFGFGDQTVVNIDSFNGYGNISHNSLDVKASYKYKFDVWGEISLMYKSRVFAYRYPADLNYIGIKYELMFSF